MMPPFTVCPDCNFIALRKLDMYRSQRDSSLLITRESIALRRAFPWAQSVQKFLRQAQPYAFKGRDLMLGSDYGGDHKKSLYKAYCFLVADSSPTCWLHRRKEIRKSYLSDGRRLSFKRLDDPNRQKALVPFLQAADHLTGHIVAVLVDKRIKRLATDENSLELMNTICPRGKWNPESFEAMARKVHFFSLCLSLWANPGSNVTWITDEDEFVANEQRLDEAHKYAAKLSSLYSPFKKGVFAMNTTAIDGKNREYEDFVAIPDLVAGMMTEVCTKLSAFKNWNKIEASEYALPDEDLSYKSALISDWFWYDALTLKRTCILINKFDEDRNVVRRLTMK